MGTLSWRHLLVVLTTGVASFALDYLRVEPSFGVSLPLWLVFPYVCILRFGALSGLLGALLGATLIVVFTRTFYGLPEAAFAMLSVLSVAIVLRWSNMPRLMDGVLLGWIFILPAAVWHHRVLISYDLNAGLLILSTLLLSQLIPGLIAQWLALQPKLLARIRPMTIRCPTTQPISIALLVRLLMMPLLLLPVLVAMHYFTTEWVYDRSRQLERSAAVFAKLAAQRAELLMTINEAPSAKAVTAVTRQLNRSVDKILSGERLGLEFDIKFEIIPANIENIGKSVPLPPREVVKQTPIYDIYQRGYRREEPIANTDLALVAVVTALPGFDIGWRYSMWSLLASLAALIGGEYLYRRWLLQLTRLGRKSIEKLSHWKPGQGVPPQLVGYQGLFQEIDNASQEVNRLMSGFEQTYQRLHQVGEERARLLSQQEATLSALEEPLVVLDEQFCIDLSRSHRLIPILEQALEPVINRARSIDPISPQSDVSRSSTTDNGDKQETTSLSRAGERFAEKIAAASHFGRAAYDIEFTVKNADQTHHYLVSIGVINSPTQRSNHGLVLLFTDISALLTTRSDLAEAKRKASLVEVATGAAHQLNQPLNIIRMAISNLQRQSLVQDDETGVLRSKLVRIDAQVDRAARIVDAMKAFEDEPGVDQSPMDCAAAVRTAVAKLASHCQRIGAQIDIDPVSDEISIICNPGAFQKIIESLLANALDAFEERSITTPIINIKQQVKDNNYILQISDNAGGIDSEILDQIFEPFITTKYSEHHPGLSLSVAWRQISDLGGKIHGSNIDGGACFTVTLPKGGVGDSGVA